MTSVEVINAITRERAIIREKLADKIVDLNAKLACQECGGSGERSAPEISITCGHCDGLGYNSEEGSLNDILPKGTTYVKLSDVLALLSGNNGIINESL